MSWKDLLARIRLLGPDERDFRRDVQEVWAYIELLERRLATAQQTVAELRREIEKGRE